MTSGLANEIADAYGATGSAWERGPGRVYNRLAEVVTDLSPVPLAGRCVLDVGAGTGAASRAIATRGGTPIALDAALGMLQADRSRRPPAVQADALALPVGDGAAAGVVAAFSLNHLDDPTAALVEWARACAPGSPIVASTYALDDDHPAKDAVAVALGEHGFEPEHWATVLRGSIVGLVATTERCAAVASRAGLDVEVHALRVPFPELAPRELVEWRLGMAQHAPFVATLDQGQRDAVVERALTLLAGAPALERSILVLTTVTS